jgi:hypothetical protein
MRQSLRINVRKARSGETTGQEREWQAMTKLHVDNLKSNSSAKITPLRPKLQFGGRAPSEDLRPADYLAKCTAAWTRPRGKETQAVWQFEIADGPHRGVGVRKWMIIADAGGVVSFSGLYASYCQLALGRSVTSDDDPADIASIFAGKSFVVRVAYRRTEKPGGGKPADDQVKKDGQDGLRVHEILRRFE